MSNNIDERVVQMQFNNAQFERNIDQSIKSLEELKKGLNLDASAKSLSGLERAGRSFSLAGISNSVEAISQKFSALGIIGVTALVNITNAAINTGKRMISSLALDPVTKGFEEYETKMNAITTILTNTKSKGTTLDDVNAALGELNTYADKTIYNFSEMTRNIGTFTAAGVGLQTSVESIKGIANLAAGSGSNAQQASTAMYQLSQAIASGSVKLMDWNSVVNAGMGGELFQNALKDTAKGMGIVVDEAIPFRESLESGWITTEVLTKTLSKLAKDKSLLEAATQVKTFTQLLDTMKESVQSGWAVSWENIIGNKGEAAALFTAISDAFASVSGESANARNEMLAFWKANEGRTAVLQGISNILLGLADILEPIEKAFGQVFPAMDGKKLVEISKAFRDLTSGFKIGEKTADNIGRTFKGLFSILDIGKQAFGFIADSVGLFIKAIIPGAGGGLLSVTAAIGDFVVGIDKSIKENNLFSEGLKQVSKVADTISKAISFLVEKLGEASTGMAPVLKIITTILGGWLSAWKDAISNSTLFSDALTTIKGSLSFVGTKLKDTVNSLTGISDKFNGIKFKGTIKGTNELNKSFEKLHGFVTSVKKAVLPVIEFIVKKLDELSMQDVGALLTGGSFLMLAKSISGILKALSEGIGSVNKIVDNFAGVIGQIGDTLKAFQMKVKAEALLKIAIALGILAVALVALSFIKIGDLAKSLGALSIVFVELVVGLTIMSKVIKKGLVSGMSTQMVALGISLLLLAKAVSIMAKLDYGQLTQGVIALSGLMFVIASFIKATNGGDLATSAGGLIGFSVGITILTGALAILGRIDQGRLQQGITSIAALMGVIATFIKLTVGGDLATSAGGLIGFSIGINILVLALSRLGNMNMEALKQGAVAISGLMLVIASFIMATNGGDLSVSAGGLIAFSIGISILSMALSKLGNMNFISLVQGGIAIGGLMTIIANFINITRGGDLATSAGGIIGFSVGINILTLALVNLANLDTVKLIQGTVAISALISVIANFINMTSEGDLAGSAGGLIGFSAGIMVLSLALSLISKLDAGKLFQGTIAITALITVIGLFINLTRRGDLQGSAGGLIGFATGIMMLAGVLAILSALNTAKLAQASVAISLLIASIALFINVTRPGDLGKSAIGMIAFAGAIAIMSAALVQLSGLNTTQLLAAGTAISVLVLAIGLFTTMTNGADLLLTAGGLVVFSGAILVLANSLTILGAMDINTLLLGIGAIAATFAILGLSSAILAPLTPVILALSAAIVILGVGIMAIGAGVTMFANGMSILSKTGTAGSAVITTVVGNLIGLIPMALRALAKGIIDFAKTIGAGASTIAGAIGDVISAMVDKVVTNTPKMVDAFFKMVSSILKTLLKYVPAMVNTGAKLLIGLLRGVAANIKAVVQVGADVIINFIEGVASKLPDLIQAGFDLIISFINGLADGIRNNTDAVIDAIGSLADAIVDALIKGLSASVTGVFNVGKNIVKGLINGMQDMVTDAANSAKNLGSTVLNSAKKALGIHSPSKFFKEIGNNIVKGLTKGIEDNTSQAVAASTNMSNDVTKASASAGTTAVKKSNESAKSAFDKAVEWIDERKYYNKLSLQEELKAWQKIQSQYKHGTEENTKADKEVYRVKQEIRKKEFDDAVQRMDDLKYYDKTSLEEELEFWKGIQKKYKHGTEENTKADKEIYRIKKEMRQEDYDDEIDTLNDKKYYNKITLEEELQFWKDMAKEYDQGTKEHEDADKEAYRVKKEMRQRDYDDAVETIDDLKYYNKLSLGEELKMWENVQAKYKEGDEERKRADKEVYRVKKEINDKLAELDNEYYSKTKELNDKLAQDIKDLNAEYDNAVKSRADSLYSAYNLFDKVEPKTVSGQDLLTNLESQVDAFDDWTSTIKELAKKGISDGLIKELENMGPSSLAEIQALNTLSQPELDKYVLLWQEKHNDAKTQAVGELENLRIETANKIAQITAETQTELDALKTAWQEAIAAINVVSEEQLNEVEKTFSTSVDTITENVKTEFADMSTAITAMDWPSIGKSICDGIANGLQSYGGTVADAARQMAKAAYDAAKATLGIHSPSKAFEELGIYSVKGFVNGITNLSNSAVNATSKLGSDSIKGFQNAVQRISEFVDAGINTEPVIRPVLDLSNVSSGVQRLSGMLNRTSINGVSLPNNQNGSPISLTINTQSLSPQELDNIFTYVNHRFGVLL